MPARDTDSAHDARRGELAVDGVSKTFRTRQTTVQALDDITLHVRPGEFVCLVGPSGCGKSTLLDIVAGLTKPDQGRVTADGQPVTGPGRHRLVMFQESALFPWLDVLGNVMFGLKLVPGLTRRRADRDRATTTSGWSGWSGSRAPTSTSCPAACASASRSPARSRPTRACC